MRGRRSYRRAGLGTVWQARITTGGTGRNGLQKRKKTLKQANKKKRGRSRNERPKSREETPKEGSEASDAVANLASSI